MKVCKGSISAIHFVKFKLNHSLAPPPKAFHKFAATLKNLLLPSLKSSENRLEQPAIQHECEMNKNTR